MIKKFEWGALVMRGQPIHKGHQTLINVSLMLCKHLLILLGSAQECYTTRNPLTYEQRKALLEKIYSKEIKNGRIIIAPLNDMSADPENNITNEWGKYVLENMKKHIGELPNAMVYGNDNARSKWFDPLDIQNIAEIIISRTSGDTGNISATQVRQLILENNKTELKKILDKKILGEIDNIRNELLKIPEYAAIYKE